MKVHEVMTRPPRTCTTDTPLDEASRLMEGTGYGALAVVDPDQRLVGILTDRDLAMKIGATPRHPSEITAGETMTANVYVCSEDEDLADALERMAEARKRRLPVLGSDQELRGILSIDDIVLWGVEHRGITPKALVRALHAICAAHQPLLETEEIEVSPEVRQVDD
jgi:CBS domain-containing protein